MVDTVTLGVIAYNEERFLPDLLRDLSSQTYPQEKTEILLIDSGSRDGTRKIMEQFRTQWEGRFRSVQVLDNPGGIQASGWNVAIRNFREDVLIRIDAHTHIPEDFVRRNMENLKAGEYVCGGQRPCLIEKDSPWARTLLEIENSLFGSSISVSRRSQKKQYVKSLFHGAYRREVFKKVGLFNENLLRTEDNEMHYRIRQNGFQICYDPEIVSYQYARSSLSGMIRQKYANGLWIGLTLGVCPGCISWYHFAPLLFVCAIPVTGILAAAHCPFFLAAMWCLYGLFTLMGMACSIFRGKGTRFTVLMPLLYLILHLSYGVGTLAGLIRMPGWRKKLR